MLSTMLGLALSLHLMAYHAGELTYTPTLAPSEIVTASYVSIVPEPQYPVVSDQTL
jgi:hypothetical protein